MRGAEMTDAQSPAGWYPDPEGSGQQRYWDGTTWTANYAPGAAPAPPGGPVVAKKGHGCLYSILGAIAIVIILIVGLAVALGGAAHKAANDITKASEKAMKEVKITSCAADSIGEIEVDGTAHNTSSGRSDYIIDVVVNDASGTQLDSSVAFANNVEPGQTAQWKAPTTAKSGPGVTCKVVTAVRHASLNS